MAASLSLTQLSSGNPVYDSYYRQVDPSGSGHVAAAESALFLKKSGLADLVLGRIWDLADAERKGSLNKQQFFIALRLVACAQNGLEVALKSLSVVVPPPKFHDTSSPILPPGGASIDCPWVVKSEEKMKYDLIFESLSPVNGILSGEKVKPVLLNSKLPVDVLGRVWELSDIDRDGMLDRDEFAVAMYLVYRALEQETVPVSLPVPLVPPSKRRKSVTPPVMPLLPSPPSHKDSRKTLPPKPPATQWVVSPADKAKYDELFTKTDSDMDGLVSGPEVRDIFLKTGLPSATLARIWELCDISDMGKLTREQFALALHLINQKLSKGLDPPQALTPEMIPPSDKLARRQSNTVSGLAADFSAIKELDTLSNEIVDLQREKSSVEQEIKEQEESIRQRSNEVQDLQDEVQREGGELQRLQSQRQEIQEALDQLDVQKAALEEQLGQIRQQCGQENQMIVSLQAEHVEQEQKIAEYEEELSRAQEELRRLQQEAARMQEKVEAARAQLSPLQDSVKESYTEVSQVQQTLSDLKMEERDVTMQLSWEKHLLAEPVLFNGATEETHEQSQEQPQEQQQQQEQEQEQQEEGESLKPPEEQEPVPDIEDDLYSSAPPTAWPRDTLESGSSSSLAEITPEVKEEKEESPKASTPKDLQDEVQREGGELQRLQSQRQEIQEALDQLDVQKAALEEQLGQIRQQCGQENQMIVSLQAEHVEQEQKIAEYEEELSRAQEELRRLQQEAARMQEKVEAARAQLSPLQDSVKESYTEVSQVQQTLSDLKMEERDVTMQLSWEKHLLAEPVLFNGATEETHEQSQEQPQEQQQQQEQEQEQQEEGESLKPPEEQEPVPDIEDDLYSSAPPTAWPRDTLESGSSSSLAEITPEVKEEKEESPKASTPKTSPPTVPGLDFFQSDPFTDHDPFKDDPFAKVDVSDPFGGDPFKGTDPFAADSFFKQPSADPFTSADPFSDATSPAEPNLFSAPLNNATGPDPFGSSLNNAAGRDPASPTGGPDPFSSSSSSPPGLDGPTDLCSVTNDPFAPGGSAVTVGSDPADPFAAVFGNETFGGGFADFSTLSKSNGADPFSPTTALSSKNVFKEDSQPSSPDVPPALPPKTGTPTRPPPTPSRSESSDSFHRRAPFLPQGPGEVPSQPAKDAAQDPFAPSSPHQPLRDPDRFASFDKYPTEEDMIEWAKRESEREEKERLARLTQQEQEDLELAIALSKSELS
ncbi:hypothetical protein SKAU_G00070610 [Synaphobranchus kaupii]|uniref:Epidermal growth factor receptor pathway substrate 15 n=1 Tax=Synaphobranchus kaupii TaxID=118154 RepID=A0A9Q1G748_SYNKA|nr:hypothetical protein SKAU_G00070610 [Synaphobranchus kaupii]